MIVYRTSISILLLLSYIISSPSPSFCAAPSATEEKADTSIFKYKKELGITDAQEKNLRNIISKLQNYITSKNKELNSHRAELNKMIADKANMYLIKSKLHTMAKIQADVTAEDIAALRAIERELTPDQMTKWRAMQAEFRKKVQEARSAALEGKGMSK